MCKSAIKTGLFWAFGLLLLDWFQDAAAQPPDAQTRSVQVITFLDAGSDSIDVPAPEMTELMLSTARADQRFRIKVVPRENESLTAAETTDVTLTGFYRIRDGKVLLDAVATLRTGPSITRQFSENGLEGVSTGLHELLQSAYCTVRIASSPPGASVMLNGQQPARTTPATFENVLKGKHELNLLLEGYQSLEKVLEVSQDTSLELTLEAAATPPTPLPQPTAAPTAFGIVKFKKMPWAKIYVDGHLLGDTATLRKINLEVGPHEIRMVSPEAGTKTLQIEIRENETYAASF